MSFLWLGGPDLPSAPELQTTLVLRTLGTPLYGCVWVSAHRSGSGRALRGGMHTGPNLSHSPHLGPGRWVWSP